MNDTVSCFSVHSQTVKFDVKIKAMKYHGSSILCSRAHGQLFHDLTGKLTGNSLVILKLKFLVKSNQNQT